MHYVPAGDGLGGGGDDDDVGGDVVVVVTTDWRPNMTCRN